ncbi:hypothetical protein TNCT_177561 [Trichonephila clavata]|uniref:Uncharacterized protein n=1 Tax=Trichonephila clavata TaxID=2740835 RepID=A0A8X6JPI0_TRICU|nr:hypothetical protein TNCT_177561 [Trichonephila clavata]
MKRRSGERILFTFFFSLSVKRSKRRTEEGFLRFAVKYESFRANWRWECSANGDDSEDTPTNRKPSCATVEKENETENAFGELSDLLQQKFGSFRIIPSFPKTVTEYRCISPEISLDVIRCC